MLKSAGYFSGVQCPTEKGKDKCCRPYCPFRHNTSNKRAGPSNSEEETTSTTDFIEDAIEKIKSDLANSRNAGGPYSGLPFSDDYNPILDSSYDPAPYTPAGSRDASCSGYSFTKPPETTKSVLHAARGPSQSVRSKKVVSKKNIYRSKSVVQPITDMEYDPVVNYSTAIKDKRDNCKRVSSDRFKRPHSSGDYGGIPEKKSKLSIQNEDDTEVREMQDPFRPSEEDAIHKFVIHEPDEEPEHAMNMIFGIESDSDANSLDSNSETVNKQENRKSDHFSLNTVIEIASEEDSDDTKLKPNACKVIDLTDDTATSSITGSHSGTTNTSKIKGKSGKRKTKIVSKNQEKKSSSKMMKDGQTQKGKIKKVDKYLNESQQRKERSQKQASGKTVDEKSSKLRKKKSEANLLKKKNEIVTAKDINISQIASYIDRDEIKKLEKDLDGGDTFQECLRIYQEGAEKSTDSYDSSESDKAEPSPVAVISQDAVEAPDAVVGKRRVAHSSAATSAISLRKPSISRKRFSTPAQMMMKRLEIVEEEKAKCILSHKSPSGRVAHKMTDKMSTLAKSRIGARIDVRRLEKKIQENPWYPEKNDEPTVCGTATKGVSRIAHESKEKFLGENGAIVPPRIAVERHSKVPTNIRQRYLTTFIDECLRIFNNDHEKAYEMAQTEEENCKKRSNTKTIYLSLAASNLKKMRAIPTREVSKTSNITKAAPKKVTKVRNLNAESSVPMQKSRKPMSHGKLLDTNTRKCKGGYTIEKKEEKSTFSAAELYEKMCRYIMTPEQLDENGYPRPCDVPGKAEFRSDPPPKPFNNADKKICGHCGKEFILNKKGRFAREEECTYHWGRAYMTRVGRGWEKRYSCCQEREGVEGCTIGDTHIHADNKLDRSGYVRTLSKSPPPDGDCGIFSLDCEMSYTVNGLELTRVSVLDHNCKLVYDTFVKPIGRVLDYNTRWSGITEKDLKNVKTTIRDVQAAFLTKFSADTILMGHSLESDLIALRIIHETVIDTSIVFPHKRGPPYKRSLKNISSDNLGLIIQTGASEGHDSAEDAGACMKLMMWKLEEDIKVSQN